MSDINYKAPRKKYFDGNSKAFINFKISVWFIGAYTPYESTYRNDLLHASTLWPKCCSQKLL